MIVFLLHFKTNFEMKTGKKHVVDSCNMLLRTAGYDLSNKLLSMMSIENRYGP
jgi:hypothetical protein